MDRVRAAQKNTGYDFPARRITANLAPADIKNEGAACDLPISVGILPATEVVKNDRLQSYIILVSFPWPADSRRAGGGFPGCG